MKSFSTIVIILIIATVEISSIYFVTQRNQQTNQENTSQNLPYSDSPTATLIPSTTTTTITSANVPVTDRTTVITPTSPYSSPTATLIPSTTNTSVTTSTLPYSSCTITSINPTTPTTFTVISPKNMCYNDKWITVSIRANGDSNWIGESFDGGSVIKECYKCQSFLTYYSFSLGKHNMTAYVEGMNGSVETAIINFEVLRPGANTTTSSIIDSTTTTQATTIPTATIPTTTSTTSSTTTTPTITTTTTQTTTTTLPTTTTTTTTSLIKKREYIRKENR